MIGPVTFKSHSIDKRGREHEPELSGRRVKQIKHEDPLITLSRRDAFVGGVLAYRDYANKILSELDIHLEMPKEKEGMNLSKSQRDAIEKIAQEKSPRLASQLYELYQLLAKKRVLKKESGTQILQLAYRLIERLEVDPSVQEMVDQYANEKHLPQEIREKLAMEVRNRIENEERNDDQVAARLGCLLLITSHDVKNGADIAILQTDEEIDDALASSVEQILEPIRLRLLEKEGQFRSYSIQSPDEALFHCLSLELADLLLLETGSINFGMIQDGVDYLIPEHFKGLAAVDTLHIVLEMLEDSPALWKIISEVEAPDVNDSPAALAVRVTLGLRSDEKITKRHAQLTVLSGFLGHFRQARAGTCFTTAPLMDVLYHQPDLFLNDLADLIQRGAVIRTVHGERREFVFQATSSNDYLNVLMNVDKSGRIIATRKYELRVGEDTSWDGPYEGCYLFDAPGIRAVCRIMGIRNPKEAVLEAMHHLTDPLTPKQLIESLSKIAFEQQRVLRKSHSAEELALRGEYAFCSQTNHPLHRAYEQAIVSSVKYVGSKYGLAVHTFDLLEKYLQGKDSGFSPEFQLKYRQLIKDLLLPLITRMRYRYNHHFGDDISLFDDGNHGVSANKGYGYELCDTGLPSDFKYASNLYVEIRQEANSNVVDRFEKYSPHEQWKLISDPEKFTSFIQDVILETASFLYKEERSPLWEPVAQKMCEIVEQKGFVKAMAGNFLSRSKGSFEKNPYTHETTPWKMKIGGDPNEVEQTFFGFSTSPTKINKFKGNQKEVLAKCIQWVKNQPDVFKEGYSDPRSQILICSPCHAFLLRPNEPTFRAAWESEMIAGDFIEQHVIQPGLAIANSIISPHAMQEALDYVASNRWVMRDRERHDFERQQLTEVSKERFDILLQQHREFDDLSLETITQIVIESRVADPRIGTRNADWERRCRLALKHKMEKDPAGFLDFARNRIDTMALSGVAAARFSRLASSLLEQKLSYIAFREGILNIAFECHVDDLCFNDKDWKDFFSQQLDMKLFELLPKRKQAQLIRTGIVTHDPNWKLEMYDFRVIWLVNPGSGKLEMANYLPDLNKISFREQKDWFEAKGGWTFPGNYLAWKDGPLFQVKKLMED